MGRKRHDGRGWTIRQESPNHTAYVRFRPAPGAKTVERSTGTKDLKLANVEAARIVAREMSGAVVTRKPTRRGAGEPLAPLVADWLLWLEPTHAATTRKTWGDYARSHFIDFFGTTDKLDDEGTAAYQRHRLAVVQGVTVRKEQSALRSLCEYALEVGAVPGPVTVPRLPKRATGTPHPTRRRTSAPPLTPAETLALIRKLPEWSSSRKVERFAIRARFVIGYETGLRPSTLDRLMAPKHYRLGSAVLRLDKASVKERWARDVPLSRRARRVLDHVLRGLSTDGKPYKGPIFGWHNYREHIATAAEAALSAETAERFCAAHLRSAMLTHSLRAGANMPGVQFLVGHTLISTTALYVKADADAAAEAIKARLPRPAVGVPHKSAGRARSRGAG